MMQVLFSPDSGYHYRISYAPKRTTTLTPLLLLLLTLLSLLPIPNTNTRAYFGDGLGGAGVGAADILLQRKLSTLLLCLTSPKDGKRECLSMPVSLVERC